MVFALAPAAQAAPITAPVDRYSGPYRLMFITTATTDATSQNIGDYNLIADTAGDLVLAGDWKVLGGTGTVGARDNTGALATGDTSYSAAIDVPIYTLSGLRVALNNTALWSGVMEVNLRDQTGAIPSFNHPIHTGFRPGGDIIAPGGSNFGGPLGELTGNVSGALGTRVGAPGIFVANYPRTDSIALLALSSVIGSTTPAADLFAITEIDYASTTGMLTLTWTSTPGEKYIVKYSSDLDWDGDFDGDLGDGIDADPVETTTTETFDLSDITPADDTRIYVRVEKEPNNG
jgi:hypothetical protein